MNVVTYVLCTYLVVIKCIGNVAQSHRTNLIRDHRDSFQILCGHTAHASFVTVIFNLLFTVTYRRDRSIREAYEERFMTERPVSADAKTPQYTPALRPPLFRFYSFIISFVPVTLGSISKDGWRSGEERPFWQTRG